MVEIINGSTVNSRDNEMYRRQILKLINETDVYIKESIELVRQWRYVTSKDESVFHEPLFTCSVGLCQYAGPKPYWDYKLTYDELFQMGPVRLLNSIKVRFV